MKDSEKDALRDLLKRMNTEPAGLLPAEMRRLLTLLIRKALE